MLHPLAEHHQLRRDLHLPEKGTGAVHLKETIPISPISNQQDGALLKTTESRPLND